MAEILALVLHHDEQAVLCAVELALDAGVATKTHVLNILHRLSDANAPPAPPIDAPQALRLAQEPVANVERYDGLRNIGGLYQDALRVTQVGDSQSRGSVNQWRP